jgi:hypothetical protein
MRVSAGVITVVQYTALNLIAEYRHWIVCLPVRWRAPTNLYCATRKLAYVTQAVHYMYTAVRLWATVAAAVIVAPTECCTTSYGVEVAGVVLSRCQLPMAVPFNCRMMCTCGAHVPFGLAWKQRKGCPVTYKASWVAI